MQIMSIQFCLFSLYSLPSFKYAACSHSPTTLHLSPQQTILQIPAFQVRLGSPVGPSHYESHHRHIPEAPHKVLVLIPQPWRLRRNVSLVGDGRGEEGRD